MLKGDVNIGAIINKVFKERQKTTNITVTSFAQRLGFQRARIYTIFANKSIDTDLLTNISKILNYNFFVEYFEDEKPYKNYL
jgi:plasmid maintenance system antidote protein VapI